MKLTPVASLSLPSSSETRLPAMPVLRVDEPPTVPPVRSAEGAMEPPVDGPTVGAPATVLPVAGPAVLPVAGAAAVPPVEAGDCGACTAVGGAGLEPSTLSVDDGLTVVEPAVVGVVVLVVSDFTTLDPPGCPSLLADSRTAKEGVELPLPLGAVLVAGLTVVLVVAGAVVGGLVVDTGTLLAVVPWAPDWVPAGAAAGAVWAEAGPALRTRKSPDRNAKDAAHLRGLTTSILDLVLIRLNRPPLLRLRARRA